MAEKGLLAYFHSPEQAEGAAAKLKALRAIDVSVDRFDKYPGEGSTGPINMYAGNFPGLGSITESGDFTPDTGVLAAADIDASGMSDGGQGGLGAVDGLDIVLSAVIDENMFEQARRVIQQAGGVI